MIKENNKTSKSNKILNSIERIGNKLPHPAAMFLYLIGIIFILSFVLSKLGISTLNPATGEAINVKNLLSTEGILLLTTNIVGNFQRFPVLAVVLMLGIATGLCDEVGLFSSSIKMGLSNVKGNSIVFIIATISIVANNAGDIAIILIPALAAAIFLGLGRHPLAGAFLGYASSCAGWGTSIVPGVVDVILSPITLDAARTVDPNFDMPLFASYFPLLLAAIMAVLVTGFVTIKIVEPMLGEYNKGKKDTSDMTVSLEEKRAVKKAGLSALAILILVVVLTIPSNSFLRGEGGSLVVGAPLMDSLTFIIITMFLVAGIVYAVSTKQVKNVGEAFDMMANAVKPLTPFIVLGTIIAQFLFFFNESNLGKVLAVKGGEFLSGLPIAPQIIVVLFFLFVGFVNIFMGGGIPKYLLLAPIIVPILMQLDIHPAFAQVIYRLGDSSTNAVTPLIAYFAIFLTTVKRYDPDAGLGTLFSGMAPYTVGLTIAYALVLVVWMTLGITTGPGGGVWLS